jgi:putative ABC transport system permease protein
VEPVMLRPEGGTRYLLARIAPDNLPATVEALRSTWQQIAPELPFDYAYLDDDLNRFYEEEQRWSAIIGYASLFAVFIACLGLFGLAAVTAASRIKEIGIRKVLGASVLSLVTLLSRDLVRLAVIATALAAPAAYVVAGRWLEGFAYHVRLGPDLFLLAGGLAFLIPLATVSYQAVKAALADPVDCLRSE